MVAPDELVVALRQAAADITATRSIRDLDATLALIVRSAVHTVPHVDAGGISLTEDGTVTSRAPSQQAVSALDVLQSDLGEGPCMTAIDDPGEDGTVVAQDLAGEDADRWPRFAPRAAEAGFRSILSVQLTADHQVRSALNLYASRPRVFDAATRRIAGLFGVQAAMLLYGSRQATYLQRAVDSRDVIGQAKGILMERFTVDDEEAFEMLVRSSQDTNLKLVDVAEWLHTEAVERRKNRTVLPDDLG